MAYPHSLRIEGLIGAAESTYLTDAEPANTNGIRGVGRIWSALGLEWAFANLREDTMSNSLIGVAPGVPQGRIVNIDYRVQLMGAGAAYSSSTPVRPECDPLLVAAGFARTHTDTSSSEAVAYDLADTGHGSATVYAYAGGKEFKIVGLRGNITWNPQAGGLGEIQFQGIGLVTAVAEASVPTITYAAVVPPTAVGMGLAIVPSGGSSWTPRAASFSVTTGHELPRLDDVNSSQGIEGWFFSATNPRLTMTARATAISTYSPYTLAAARTVQTIDATLGSTQYNRVKLDVNLAYLLNDPQPADDQGFAAWALEFMLRDLQIDFD